MGCLTYLSLLWRQPCQQLQLPSERAHALQEEHARVSAAPTQLSQMGVALAQEAEMRGQSFCRQRHMTGVRTHTRAQR